MRRRRSQRLVIDDEDLARADDEPIDLAGNGEVADQPDDRHLGLRFGSEQRREIGIIEDRQDLLGDRALLLRCQVMDRPGKKASGCGASLWRREIGQDLQQTMDEEAALEPGRLTRAFQQP